MRKFRRLPEDERPAPAKGSKLAEALQVPAGAVSVLPRMEFCGNREVTIDGSKGVDVYKRQPSHRPAADQVFSAGI